MISAARTTDQPAARHLQAVPAEKPGTVAVPPALIALFRIPFQIAVTADVWADLIKWSHPTGTGHRHQSEEARLTDLLWMVTVAAAQPITLGRAHRFNMWRVPTTPRPACPAGSGSPSPWTPPAPPTARRWPPSPPRPAAAARSPGCAASTPTRSEWSRSPW